jgi:hypothetical protein
VSQGVGKPRAQVSTRQRPGRRFQPSEEAALFESAKQAAAQLPGADAGVLGLTELHAPFGIPDFTVVIGEAGPRRARLRLRVPPLLNEVDAGLASVTPSESFASARQIAARVGWPAGTIERRLPGLLRVGALREVQPGRFTRPTALEPIGTVYAIELKVNDWRRALVQCRTYRTWADSYVLIMQRVPGSSLSDLRRNVRRDGGGLIIDNEWLVQPRVVKLPRSRRLWTSEHIVAACRRPTTSNPPAARIEQVLPKKGRPKRRSLG